MLSGALAGWKEWHRDVAEAAGCDVVERTVTLEAVKAMADALRWRDAETEKPNEYPVICKAGGVCWVAQTRWHFIEGGCEVWLPIPGGNNGE